MRTYLMLLVLLARVASTAAQQLTGYHPAARRVNDLVHAKLAVRFDYAKRCLYGQEWVTLKPRAYATDTLRLDAKGMDINAVAMVHGTAPQPLKYEYNQQQLVIHLGRLVLPDEAYTIYLDYTAKPNSRHLPLASIGSAQTLVLSQHPGKPRPVRFADRNNGFK